MKFIHFSCFMILLCACKARNYNETANTKAATDGAAAKLIEMVDKNGGLKASAIECADYPRKLREYLLKKFTAECIAREDKIRNSPEYANLRQDVKFANQCSLGDCSMAGVPASSSTSPTWDLSVTVKKGSNTTKKNSLTPVQTNEGGSTNETSTAEETGAVAKAGTTQKQTNTVTSGSSTDTVDSSDVNLVFGFKSRVTTTETIGLCISPVAFVGPAMDACQAFLQALPETDVVKKRWIENVNSIPRPVQDDM